MAEEKNKLDDKYRDYPEPVVAAIIYNDQGEIFLTQSSKWGDYWQIPGGHVEIGETCEEALRREIKEETGYEIDNIETDQIQDCINPELFHRPAHFIFLNYFARLAGGELGEKNYEMEDYKWVKPEEALKMKLNPYTKIAIENFIAHQKKENWELKFKRALADYQNLIKQVAAEKSDFARYANERLIEEILPVYDNMKLALKHSANGQANGVEEGIKHVLRQFKNILEQEGVEEIETVGKKYDPHAMEAMGHKETKEKKEDGLVAEELKPGYKLNSKVIIPARVTVYEHKS